MAGSINRTAVTFPPGLRSAVSNPESPLLWCQPTLTPQGISNAHLAQEMPLAPVQSLFINIPFTRDIHQFHQRNIIVTRQYSLAAYYVDALCKEIQYFGGINTPQNHQEGKNENSHCAAKLQCLHLGGVMPTFLMTDDLARLLACIDDCFTLSTDQARRYSISIDPKSFTIDTAFAIKELGFNRVHFYLEDFSPDVQFVLNRKYSVQKIESVIAQAKRAGITAVDIECVYGLPMQTEASFLTTLQHIARFSPASLTLRLLQPDSGSYGLAHDSAMLPTLTAIEAMQNTATGFGHNLGYIPGPGNSFEQSNKHKSNRLTRRHLGLGLHAISGIGKLIWQNQQSLREYIRRVNKHGNGLLHGSTLNQQQQMAQYVTGHLFNHGKLSKSDFQRVWNCSFDAVFATQRQALSSIYRETEVIDNNSHIVLTEAGRWQVALIANMLVANL